MKNIKNNILKVTVLIMSFYTQVSEGTTIDDLQVEVANYGQDEVVSFVPISVD